MPYTLVELGYGGEERDRVRLLGKIWGSLITLWRLLWPWEWYKWKYSCL